jgi:hypothetical protein
MASSIREELRLLQAGAVRRPRNFIPSEWSPWRVGAAVSLGVVLGISATLILAPERVIARDDGRYALLPVRSIPAAAQASTGSNFFLAPLVRQFAPAPVHQRVLPEAIRHGGFGSGDLRPSVTRIGEPKKKRPRKGAAAKTHDAPPAAATAGSGGRGSFCVRTCDGFFFPVPAGSGTAAQATLCQAACPGTEVRPFSSASGEIDQAFGTDGKPYSALPAAFAFQRSQKAACTCGRPADRYAALIRDITLRPGDAVVVGDRTMVFKGAGHWPYGPKDFVEFRQEAAKLTPRHRDALDAAVGASLRDRALKRFTQQRRPAVAGNPAEAPDTRRIRHIEAGPGAARVSYVQPPEPVAQRIASGPMSVRPH